MDYNMLLMDDLKLSPSRKPTYSVGDLFPLLLVALTMVEKKCYIAGMDDICKEYYYNLDFKPISLNSFSHSL